MREFGNKVLEDVWRHRGKLTGIVLGFVVGWIFLQYGLLRTLIFLLFVVLGYVIGSKWDAGEETIAEWVRDLYYYRRRR